MQSTMLHVDAVKHKVETALSQYFYKHNANKINLKFASPSQSTKTDLRCGQASKEQKKCGRTVLPLGQPIYVHEVSASNSGFQ